MDDPTTDPALPAGHPDPWHPSRFARRILEGAGEGIVVYDRELRYRWWNPFMEERTGLRAADAYGQVAATLFPYLAAEGIVALMHRALAGETVESGDVAYASPFNGRRGWFAGKYEPYTDDAGTVIGVLAHVHDTTARREAEERLRRSEARFRTLIESASDIVTILDAAGIVTYASPSVREVLGISPEELVGRNPASRVHPEDRERVVEAFRQVIAQPGASAACNTGWPMPTAPGARSCRRRATCSTTGR